jgi:hypothetical protein
MGKVRKRMEEKQGMSEWMRKILESKRRKRQQLAALPFSEKLKILEKLRDRSLAIGVVREKPAKKYGN